MNINTVVKFIAQDQGCPDRWSVIGSVRVLFSGPISTGTKFRSEHPFPGFTYLPETFMKHQITFYNFPTPDFGCWESHIMLQILKVLEFAATEGAIGVHCHAGLGRTGTGFH